MAKSYIVFIPLHNHNLGDSHSSYHHSSKRLASFPSRCLLQVRANTYSRVNQLNITLPQCNFTVLSRKLLRSLPWSTCKVQMTGFYKRDTIKCEPYARHFLSVLEFLVEVTNIASYTRAIPSD